MSKQTYTRITRKRGYFEIVTVNTDGVLNLFNRWDDGQLHHVHKATLEEMGWKSLREFLAHRPGFTKDEAVNE